MKTKTYIKESKNFLNNQNYIFGKTENKKLLSKFFVEKFFLKLVFGFSIINSLIYNKSYNYKINGKEINIVFLLSITIIFFGFSVSSNRVSIMSTLFFFTPIFLFFLYFIIRDFKLQRIKSIKGFLLNDEFSIFNFFLIIGLIFSIISYIYGYTFLNRNLVILILIILFIPFIIFNKTPNIFNIIFIPLILIFVLLSLVFSYLLTYIVEAPMILKFYPETSLITKFIKLKNKSAENKYYKIIEK